MRQTDNTRRTQLRQRLLSAITLLGTLMITGPTSAAGHALSEPVQLQGFAIDKTEVTIAQYGAFVKATKQPSKAEQEGGGFEYGAGWERRPGWSWQSPDGQADADPHLPAVHLNHAEAVAYCAWRGGRLPTAREWLHAAFTEQRATTPAPFVRGRTYPWPTGDSPAGANTSGNDPWKRAAPAGATKAGVNGLYDMGANVWEWVADARGDERRTMGGSWWYGNFRMQASDAAWKPAHFYAVYIGFRCAYAPSASAS